MNERINIIIINENYQSQNKKIKNVVYKNPTKKLKQLFEINDNFYV